MSSQTSAKLGELRLGEGTSAGVFALVATGTFESIERLREWYDSPEYAPLKELRTETTSTEFVVVEGL